MDPETERVIRQILVEYGSQKQSMLARRASLRTGSTRRELERKIADLVCDGKLVWSRDFLITLPK